MIIYNVTTKVQANIATMWLEWIKAEHIPDIIETACFTHATILRLLETDDTDGPTYAIQYFAESQALYNQYIDQFAEAMRQKAFQKWGDGFISFRSVMSVVN